MALKIPELKRQVGLSTPVLSTPVKPQLSSPRVIPAAFGAGVGEAMQELGKVGEKIASHLQQKALDNFNKEVLDRNNAAKKEMNVWLSEQLSKQLEQSKGSTDEFTQQYEESKEKFLSGLNKYQVDILAPKLDAYFVSQQNRVINHEANQDDLSFRNSTNSGLEQSYLDASAIRNPENNPKELEDAIGNAIAEAQPYYSRFDKATRELKEEDIASNVIKSAAMSLLQETGDFEGSVKLLDSVKNTIPKSTYNEIKSKLKSGSNTIQKALDRIRIDTKVKTRMENIDLIVKGKLDWTNIDDEIKRVARTDPKLAQAMQDNVKKGFTPEKLSNEKFMKLAVKMFESGTQEEVSDFLVTALSDTNSVSQDDLGSLVYAAKKRNEELNGGKSGFWSNLIKSFVALNLSIPLSFTLKRAKDENADDKRAEEIMKEEINNTRKKENPEIITIDDGGQEMIDVQGNRAIVYPDGRIEEIR